MSVPARNYSAPVPPYPAGARTASVKNKRTRPKAMPTAVRILSDALRTRWLFDRLDFLINAETADIKSIRSCPANTNVTFPVRICPFSTGSSLCYVCLELETRLYLPPGLPS